MARKKMALGWAPGGLILRQPSFYQAARERQRERERERERERKNEKRTGRERIPRRLSTVSAEPDEGLELMNHEIMT